MITSPPAMVPSPLPTPSAAVTLHDHNCTQFAFQTLNSLYTPPASTPWLGESNCTSDHRRPLDVGISTNKAAVDKLFILLECPCSSNPHFSTTIAVAVLKILSSYHSMASTDEPKAKENAHMSVSAHRSSPPRRPQDQNSIRTQKVLGELRKVEKLIDKFSDRYCHATNQTSVTSDGNVYNALEQQLRTQVRDTFKATMKTAPEDIRRQIASRSSHNRIRVNTM